MDLMAALSNIYNAVFRLYNLKGHNVHQLTTNEMKIIRMLQKSKIIYEI